ncbi:MULTISPECIES: DJ-1 family glyoxalase III [unclassified Pseudomonas]|uniref:DJ-1 family glyoxalase III n=1 Tax=unclassified Pseudomonas TaxID=196821 RepID=UPI0008835AF0|nr:MULTISPECIES: DJ-1 family glyoxalase III [unclassified Pseudomonas]SCZ05036.1 4-methyl-5(b-hydroxyethyl)-thiazole monophosphate biosynthesis [Pseudomonas sp. NFACC37-1]SFO69252.1 4-methyl-5(b-hydroxyethyl)-thiazole monophosphate biosynthesis [Pseudomonas sp. NFACC24-1]
MMPGTKIPRALIAVAEGVDDLQTVTLIDVLRRAQIETVVASIEGRRMLTCARGTRLTADGMLVDVLAQDFDLVVLPGGIIGAQHLAAHQPLQQRLKDQAATGRFFAAIAEAPALALQASGVLRQRRMTCLPAVSQQLSGCSFVDQPVVVDGNCITAQGSAAALAFALTLVEQLCGKGVRSVVAAELLA